MKITKQQLKQLIKEEMSSIEEAGGGGMSPKDLSQRFSASAGQLEDVVMDYVESGWLEQNDWGSISQNLEQAFDMMDKLRNTLKQWSENVGGEQQ